MNNKKVELVYEEIKYDFSVLEGTFGAKLIDIATLNANTGFKTLDVGLKNTAITNSKITYLNGDKGILLYRGYPIEQLSSQSTFEEVSYLLIYGELPTIQELTDFRRKISENSIIDERIKILLQTFDKSTHPMALLISLTVILDNELDKKDDVSESDLNEMCIKLIGQFKVLVSWIYRNKMNLGYNYSNPSLNYVEDFCQLLFDNSKNDYHKKQSIIDAVDKLLILHADHEQNCSTFTVRTVGSSQASVYASISAGISALWGKLHGGANQEVIEMIEQIKKDGGDIDKYINKAKSKESSFRLMGVGHRVYKNFDPRAEIIKAALDTMLDDLKIDNSMLKIAKSLENSILLDPYFIDRKLYPNVDFYSGLIYQTLDMPKEMFTVIFALGRLPGWLAHWKEMKIRKEAIVRPFQVYTGASKRDYINVQNR